MKKILIILNAVKYNRGSEALIRGLTEICRKEDEECHICLVSSEKDFESTVRIEGIQKYINRFSYQSEYSPTRIISGFAARVLKNDRLAASIKYRRLLKYAEKMDVVFVIGADNYDKSYNMYKMLHQLNVALKARVKGKLYLYDCSLDKDDINSAVIKDFSLFDAVTVRECVTLENLTGAIDENKIKYYPDPAFVMRPKKISLPEQWVDEKMIGINLSSLILDDKYGSGKDLILKTYCNMIDYILKETEYHIVFIPHVMQGQDLKVLKLLFDKYKDTKKVVLIDNEELNARQLKYIISKLRFLITARTHASIAAYSSCVPTLVLGYSVKSIGIAKDLFGTEENYVISTKNLQTGKELVGGVKWLIENEEPIKGKLEEVIPKYKKKAFKAKELIK